MPLRWSHDMAGFHAFVEHDGAEYGCFEVYWISEGECNDMLPGWYWFTCPQGPHGPEFGNPVGPFETAYGAWNDARMTGGNHDYTVSNGHS